MDLSQNATSRLVGKRFLLQKSGLGLDFLDYKRNPIVIPPGATIKIVSDPSYGDGLVNVIWETREVSMFLSDIGRVGKEIVEEDPPLPSFDW